MIVFVAALAVGVNGCKSKEDKKQNRTLQGTIESVDLPTKTVTMNWFNEKWGKPIIVAGRVTNETEIYVDGKIGDLGQVKVGDKVIVEGYKKGADIVAVKVNVTHSAEESHKIVKPGATTQPAK